MDPKNQILFFFSSLGAFNGLLLSAYYFFFAKPKNISNYFLGMLLLALSIRVWKSVFFYFNPDLAKIYLQIGLTACFFIGPALYLYIWSLRSKNNHSKIWIAHLAVLLGLALVVGLIYPYQEHSALWNSAIFKVIYYSWLFYILIAAVELVQFFKQEQVDRILRFWVLSIFIGNGLIWLVFFTANYTSYIVGSLCFSFVFYILIAQLVFLVKSRQLGRKSEKKRVPSNQSSALLETLRQKMEQEKLYKDPNLTIAEVAKTLSTTLHVLSQVLNEQLDKNFAFFINEYRIKEAKFLLINEPNFTIEAIAYDSGFNSTSTFYASFKKIEGMTPASYRKKYAK